MTRPIGPREGVGTGGGVKNDFLNVSLSLNAHACDVGKREVRRIAPPGETFGGPIFRYMQFPLTGLRFRVTSSA